MVHINGRFWIRNFLDYRCCCKWNHCLDSTEVKQRDSTSTFCSWNRKAGKKELNGLEANIPDDGLWLYKFSTRSSFDKAQRFIQHKKFYATLPHKLDNAVEVYKAATPEPDPALDWHLEEVGEFGQDGWTISYTHKSVKKDDWNSNSSYHCRHFRRRSFVHPSPQSHSRPWP